MKLRLFFCGLVLATGGHAGEAPSRLHAEIEYLLEHIENSGCQFKRNDAWHSGAQAAAHIRKKHQYLLANDQLKTTESFILKAASESSATGVPYEVKCAGKPSVLSYIWFNEALSRYRTAKGA